MGKSRKEREYASASERADKHESFERTCVTIPDEMVMFNPKKPGTYKLDIAPYIAGVGNPNAKKGQVYYERTFFVHRSVGPDQNSYVCNARTFGKKCPICDHRGKLQKSADYDKDEIKELRPKERQLFVVFDHGEPDKGWQLWDISFHLFGKTLDDVLKDADPKDKERWSRFFHPTKGYLVRASFKEKSFKTQKFLECNRIEFRKREEQYDEDLVDETPCLDELLIETPYKELKELFLQTGDDDEEDSDDTDTDDDEDEDEDSEDSDDSDDDEDEDEEEEKPKKGKKAVAKKSSKKKKDEDEDDEDEEEDEEDEDVDDEEEDEDDSDDDEDEDDADEEDEEEDEDEYELGDKAKFKYKGKWFTGKISKINTKKGILSIKCEDHLHAVAIDDKTLSKVEPDDDDEDEEDEEDEKPKKGKKKPEKKSSKKSPKDEDWDDEDDEDEEDDDEDEDDSEEDEDEEEEKPKKSSKKKPVKKSFKKEKPKKGKKKDDEEEDDDPF